VSTELSTAVPTSTCLAQEPLDVTEGKRCSKCSNMRPRTYYIGDEGTCRWHLPQRKAASLRLQAMRQENLRRRTAGSVVADGLPAPSTDV
jgi:hypothetical protein